ncbi:MAG: hypothetical protein QW367_02950 [Candidatus Aenigmatarchaeota archaeon]
MKFYLFLSIFIFQSLVFAHCPLCTAGAGIGALFAKELGTKSSVLGIWIGAFGAALGLWIASFLQSKFNLNKKFKNTFTFLLVLISFLSTVLPLQPYFYELGSFYINLFGEYGSLFNTTYVYDKFLLGAILGAIIVLIYPLINKKIIEIYQKRLIPFQGLTINFILLIFASLIFQIWI